MRIHLRLPIKIRRKQDGVEPPLLPRELIEELSEMSTDLRLEYEEELQQRRPRSEEEAYAYAYIMA